MLWPVLPTWVFPSRRQIAEKTDRPQVTLRKCEPWPARSVPVRAKTILTMAGLRRLFCRLTFPLTTGMGMVACAFNSSTPLARH